MITYYAINLIAKKLVKGLKKTGGRNNFGRVTVRGQGGGNKVLYRRIDFYRRLNQYGYLIAVLYDPNRTCKLGLIFFENSFSAFILIQKDVPMYEPIYLGSEFDESDITDQIITNGYSLPLNKMPLYSILSNIEFKPFKGKSLCRAADTSCVLIGKTKTKGILKLNSK
jgi:large subunit ribosomal protein L2